MQLHQLAGVIFVEATVDPGGLVAFGWIRTRHARAPVVEIEKHRRRVRGGAEQIAKASQRVRANCLSIECGEQIAIERQFARTRWDAFAICSRSEEHTSELQSRL